MSLKAQSKHALYVITDNSSWTSLFVPFSNRDFYRVLPILQGARNKICKVRFQLYNLHLEILVLKFKKGNLTPICP